MKKFLILFVILFLLLVFSSIISCELFKPLPAYIGTWVFEGNLSGTNYKIKIILTDTNYEKIVFKKSGINWILDQNEKGTHSLIQDTDNIFKGNLYITKTFDVNNGTWVNTYFSREIKIEIISGNLFFYQLNNSNYENILKPFIDSGFIQENNAYFVFE